MEILYMLGSALVGIVLGGSCVYLAVRDEWRSETDYLNRLVDRKTIENNELMSKLAAREIPRCYDVTDDQIAAFLRGESIEKDYFTKF